MSSALVPSPSTPVVLVRDSLLFADALAWSLAEAGFAATVSKTTEPLDPDIAVRGCHVVVLDGDRPFPEVLSDAQVLARNGATPAVLLLVGSRTAGARELAARIHADACLSRNCDLSAVTHTLAKLAVARNLPRQRSNDWRPAVAVVSSAGLTDREMSVLRLVADGSRNQQIAAMLGISPNTVRTHLQNILAKLGVHSRFAAVTAARRAGMLSGGQVESAPATP